MLPRTKRFRASGQEALEAQGGSLPLANGSRTLLPRKRATTYTHPMLDFRSNNKIAEHKDADRMRLSVEHYNFAKFLRQKLFARKRVNVVDLFAGIGGMSLGFLLANSAVDKHVRIVATAEFNTACVATLRRSRKRMVELGIVPQSSVPEALHERDLRRRSVRQEVATEACKFGPVDVLLGGPPCQGFSTSNRSQTKDKNPNNELVYAFIDCVRRMTPKVIIMENVQGICWTRGNKRNSTKSALETLVERLKRLGYQAFPKLIDASWYGVPQRRQRVFVVAIRSDYLNAGSIRDAWGPFPKPSHGPGSGKPFVTVADAIASLPKIRSGEVTAIHAYQEQTEARANSKLYAYYRHKVETDEIFDHTTSAHSERVLCRISKISPGRNWSQIKELFHNYADIKRTHSNLYRRLEWNKPSVTIGHVRKNLLIHPEQNRTLSLREAARIQSFPDWFRLHENDASKRSKLDQYQQQLANAVCPLVTKALAEFLFNF